MEDTLRALEYYNKVLKDGRGLNPCFNGRYSQSGDAVELPGSTFGLNPCFNGRYSQR